MILKNLFKNEKRQEFVDRNTLFPNIRERVRSNIKELSRSPSDFLGATKERLGGVTGTLFSNVEEIRRSPGDFISAVPKSTRQKLKESPIATQSSRFLDGARDTLRDNREEFKRSPRLFLQSIPRAFDIRATQAGLRESLRGAKLKMLGQTLGIPFLNSLIPKSEETDEEYIQRKVKDINQNLLLVDIPPAIVKVFTQEGKAEKFKDIGLNNLAGGMQLTYSRIADRFSDSPAVLDEGHVQETLKSLSDTLRTASDRNLAEAREASGKLFQLNLKDPNNRQEAIAQAILVNSPNTLGALIVGGGAGLIGGPKASVLALYAYSSALEGGFARHEAEELAREQGKELTDRELDTLMAGVGIIGGALESFAPFRLLNRLSKTAKTTLLRNATRIMLQTGGEEGVTEVLQELVSNMAMKLKDLKDDVFEGLSESGLIGFLSGLLFAGGGSVVTQTLRRGAVGLSVEDINQRIDTLEKRDELTPEEETELAQLKQSTDTQPLLEEARKFDTAEEFVEAQGEPVFHFTDKVNIASIEKDGLRATLETEGKITEGISLATKRTEANEIFGNAKVTVYINPKAKTITLKDALDRMGFAGETDIGVIKNLETKVPSWAAENGYDVLDMRDARGAIYKGMDEIRILNPEVIKTKSQLTDIFNQSKQQIKGGPTPQKLGIQEGRPAPFVNKRETTLLKDRIRALARGTREGRADQKGDIREIQNDLIKEVSDVLPNDISRITRILRDTNTREKLLDAIVDIDRIAQNRLDKEQADLLRRKNINIARGLRQGGIQTRQTISERLRLLNDLIDNSNLTAKDKAKFRFTPKQISSIKNEATFQSKINDVVDRISKLESAERFRNARSRIEKIIKSTKIKNRISKFPAELQDSMQNMFNQFREDLKLNQDQAGEKIKEIMKELDGEIPTLQQKLRLQLLGIKVGSDLIDEQDATQIAEDLESIVEEGRGLKDLRTFEQWQDLQNNIEDILDGLELGEGIETFGPEKKSILEGIKNRLKILGINALTDWRGTQMDIEWNKPLGEKKIAETLGNVTPQNKQYANLYGQYDREVSRVIRESYPDRYKKKFKRLPDKVRNSLEFNPWTEGFSSKLVIIDLINEEVNLGKLKNRDGVVRELTFKRGELIKRWVELQDLTLTESFFRGNRYIQETIDAIDNAMTPQDKAFAKETMRMWQDLYDLINPVYKKIYGINLPKNPFYSNIRREGFEVDIENQFGEFLGEQNFRKAVTSGSFNERTNSILPIKTQDVFQALDKHFGEMTYFIAWAERVRQFHSIYNNKSVRDGVINTFGKNAGGKLLERIDFQIREFASKGHRNSTNFGKVAGKARRGFIMGKIFFKPVMFFKQLVSRVNWLEVLGPIELTTGEYEFWKSPKEKSKILRKESPILRERGKFFERDINDVLKSDEYARYSKFRAFLELGAVYTKVGDADATIFPGSWAYRKKLMKERGLDPNGQAPEEVIAIYEDFADNTNQSANISTQSEWQQSGPLAKLFTLFRTQQHQNARKVVNVVKSVFQEGGTSKKNLMKTARTIVIYHSIQNMLFQLVGTGLIQLIGDDDEEFVKDMARAGLLGSLNFLPLGYDLISSIIRAVMGSQVFNRGIQDTPISSISKDIYNLTREIDPTKIEDFEVMEFIQDLATVTSDFGPPAEQALNLGRGIHSMTEGNFLRGTLEMLQWSQWALEPLGEDEENVDLSIDLFKKKSKETERDTSLRRRGGSTGVTPRGGSTGVTPRGSNQNSVLKSMFR